MSRKDKKKDKEKDKKEEEEDVTKETKEISILAKWHDQMALIQEKTGIKGIYVIIGLAICILLIYFNIFESIITNLVGTVYPFFWTMKSIEVGNNDDKMWLSYWVVFAAFTILDMFISIIIAKVIPFYCIFKVVFLIWLFLPNTRGCDLMYHLLVKRVFKSFENDIDSYVDNMKEITNEFVFSNGNASKIEEVLEFNKNNQKKKNQ